jgi:transposase
LAGRIAHTQNQATIAPIFVAIRQRLLAGDIADAFFAAVLKQPRQRDLVLDEHFTVDGTLLEARFIPPDLAFSQTRPESAG